MLHNSFKRLCSSLCKVKAPKEDWQYVAEIHKCLKGGNYDSAINTLIHVSIKLDRVISMVSCWTSKHSEICTPQWWIWMQLRLIMKFFISCIGNTLSPTIWCKGFFIKDWLDELPLNKWRQKDAFDIEKWLLSFEHSNARTAIKNFLIGKYRRQNNISIGYWIKE